MPDYRTFAISTFDNPFNPFEDFDNWFLYDCEKDYYSLTKVARLAKVDDSMTEKEYAILLSTLIYNIDKHANTLGHFEAYIKKPIKKTEKEREPCRLLLFCLLRQL